jgi:hypothetical protein
MTRPNWLTAKTLRWIAVSAVLLSIVGVRVRRYLANRNHRGPSLVLSPPSPEARALLAPLSEGSTVSDWTIRTVSTDRDNHTLNLSFANAGRTIGVQIALADSSGPRPPVREGPYVVFYNAHGDLSPVGFSLARAVGAAIRPHASAAVPSDLRH